MNPKAPFYKLNNGKERNVERYAQAWKNDTSFLTSDPLLLSFGISNCQLYEQERVLSASPIQIG